MIVDYALQVAGAAITDTFGSERELTSDEEIARAAVGAFMEYIDSRRLQDLSIPDECMDGIDWLAEHVSRRT